ncbi:MAG TPA: hypothetical protein VM490_13295 [Armatimonadaceae bacterium]|nr:hypothetical protein [Armatimonadaceae bacterium]
MATAAEEFGRAFYDTGPDGETLIYDVERLWRISSALPVRRVPLTQVEGELDCPQWFQTTNPSPRAVALHARRIYEADLCLPVILSAKGIVMDGVHRIAKAWLLGQEDIAAVQFARDPEPDHVVWPQSVG